MKSDIHPRFYHNCKVYHNGQVVMTTGATVPELHVEVWSGSHPFFTGKQTFVDAAGRVEKFQRKFQGNYFKKDAKKEPVKAGAAAEATASAGVSAETRAAGETKGPAAPQAGAAEVKTEAKA